MARGNHSQAVCLDSAASAACLTALQPTRARFPFALSASVLRLHHCRYLLLAERAELSPEALRQGGRSARGVAARDGFIRRAILAAGSRTATVASVVGCQASTMSRTLQKEVSAR